jgi:hypothetical protein
MPSSGASRRRLARTTLKLPKVATYTWDVFTPGADLPQLLETDYLLDEGEEVEIGGRTWLVERVEIADDSDAQVMQAYVTPAQHSR